MALDRSRLASIRQVARQFYQDAVAAVDPAVLVRQHLELITDQHAADGDLPGRDRTVVLTRGDQHWRWPLPLHVLGAGKAAAQMALGVEQAIGPAATAGIVVTAPGCQAQLGTIETIVASHPVPDERSVAASRRLLEYAAGCRDGSLCFLISGGASSLLALPAEGLTLADKQATTRLLLACGAAIEELNTVRKHLSAIKGGGLALVATRPLFTLAISDVVGDDLATIGSGPTVADPTTFTDAWQVIRRYGLENQIPPRVRTHLRAGCDGHRRESLKAGDQASGPALVIGSNRLALAAAARAAGRAGWNVVMADQAITGDTSVAAAAFAAWIREQARAREQPTCLLAGGETTVHVQGTGRGGRNQEFALFAAARLEGLDVVVLSAGSDGIDGPTDAAGAIVDGTTALRARTLGLSLDQALADNNSYPVLDELGDLLRTGPTGTNVMDVKIALLPRP